MLCAPITHPLTVWYPDNTNRRDRADQLSNDITVIQTTVQEARVEMDKSDARMLPFINQFLTNNGLQSFDDLQKKLEASLTPDQKKSYDDVSLPSPRTHCRTCSFQSITPAHQTRPACQQRV